MKSKTRKVLDILYLFLSVLILIASAVIGYFVFKTSYIRIEEGCIDVFNSIKVYFNNLLNIKSDSNPTVVGYSQSIALDNIIARTPDGVSERFNDYWALFLLNGPMQ